MDTEIILIYCLLDDMLKMLGHRDDAQVRLSSAEVMTTAVVSARYFGGQITTACEMLKSHGYIPEMLSPSQFNRRLHQLDISLWESCLQMLAEVFHQDNPDKEYIVDSFPVPVCDNIRIKNSSIYTTEDYRGRMAGKRRYFYGLRVHVLTTATGKPVEVLLTPGSWHDGTAFRMMNCDLPDGSIIYADKIYNDAHHEQHLREHAGIRLLPLRKKNMRDQFPHYVRYIQGRVRQRIESSFSQLTAMFPKSIHAVRPRGFELKVIAFILAFAIQCL